MTTDFLLASSVLKKWFCCNAVRSVPGDKNAALAMRLANIFLLRKSQALSYIYAAHFDIVTAKPRAPRPYQAKSCGVLLSPYRCSTLHVERECTKVEF